MKECGAAAVAKNVHFWSWLRSILIRKKNRCNSCCRRLFSRGRRCRLLFSIRNIALVHDLAINGISDVMIGRSGGQSEAPSFAQKRLALIADQRWAVRELVTPTDDHESTALFCASKKKEWNKEKEVQDDPPHQRNEIERERERKRCQWIMYEPPDVWI